MSTEKTVRQKLKKSALLFAVLIIMMLFSGTAMAYGGPTISNLTPGNFSGVNHTNYDDKFGYNYIPISAKVYDIDGIYTSNMTFTVTGNYDGFTWVYEPLDSKSGTFYGYIYGPKANSQFNISLTVKDTKYNTSTVNWLFNYDTSPPVILTQLPPNSVTPYPDLSAKIIDITSGIDTASIVAKIDGVVVNHNLTSVNNIYYNGQYYSGYNLSYTPTTPMDNGLHKLEITVKDNGGLNQSASMDFNVNPVNSTPVLSWLTPQSSYITSYNAKRLHYFYEYGMTSDSAALLSATIEDPQGIDPNSITASLNTPYLCYETEYIPLTPEKGQINVYIFQDPYGSYDGRYTLDLSAKDAQNSLVSGNLDFTIDTMAPTITNNLPISNLSSLFPTISAQANDEISGMDSSTLILKVDGSQANTSVTANGNGFTMSYTPSAPLPVGQHFVEMNVKDKAGWPVAKSWSFNITDGNVGPTVTYSSPEDNANGSIYYDYDEFGNPSNPRLYLYAVFYDYDGIKSGTLPITIKFPSGEIFTASPDIIYDTADQTKAHILYYLYNFPTAEANNCEFSFEVQDKPGAVTSHLSLFSIGRSDPQGYVITPTDGSGTSNRTPLIAARIYDNTIIDTQSVFMKIDGAPVIYNITPTPGYPSRYFDVTYTPPENLYPGTHNVELNFNDIAGNPGYLTWSFDIHEPTPPEFSNPWPNNSSPIWGSYVGINVNVFSEDGLMPETQRMTVKYPDGHTAPLLSSFNPGETSNSGQLYSEIYNAQEGAHEITATIKSQNGLENSYTWTFNLYKDQPAYTYKTPVNGIADIQPVISAKVTDPTSGINASTITMKIDDKMVTPTLEPVEQGYIVKYAPAEPFPLYSDHTVEIYCQDNAGNARPVNDYDQLSGKWSFYIGSMITASQISPVPASTSKIDSPLIKVHFYCPEGIDLSSRKMTIDGQTVLTTVSTGNNGQDADISCQTKLNTGTHNVSVTVASKKGILKTQNWSFTIEGRDMAYLETGNDTCNSCHSSKVYGGIAADPGYNNSYPDINFMKNPASEIFDDIHSVNIADYHENNCFNCHGTSGLVVTPGRNSCDLCHQYGNGTQGSWNLYPYNAYHSDFKPYTYKDHNASTKYEITSPRKSQDCMYCHQQPRNFTPVFANHDIISSHKINFPDPSCSECHNENLTREHAADNRTDSSGKAITCGTCHNSSDSKIKNAIINYQPLRYRIFQSLGISGLTSLTSQEYAIPGKQITGARFTTYDNLKGNFHVQGYWDSSWHDIYVKSFGNNYPWPSLNPSPYSFQTPTSTTIPFPRVAEKVRIVFDNFYTTYVTTTYRAEAKLDQWQVTPQDNITCSSCHDITSNHVSEHNTNLDTNCATCHNNNLMLEHVDNRAKSCADCHSSTNPTYGQAISFKQNQCSDCHRTGHGLNFRATVPSSIPLHPDFAWTAPQNADLFAGESWMPDEFIGKDAKLIMSNRLNTVSGNTVWAWYRGKMQELGWTLATAEPPSGAVNYSATFTKGTAKVVLWYYGGDTHTANQVLAAGSRLELIYKAQ